MLLIFKFVLGSGVLSRTERFIIIYWLLNCTKSTIEITLMACMVKKVCFMATKKFIFQWMVLTKQRRQKYHTIVTSRKSNASVIRFRRHLTSSWSNFRNRSRVMSQKTTTCSMIKVKTTLSPWEIFVFYMSKKKRRISWPSQVKTLHNNFF